MGDTKKLAHTQWNCKYHIVFAPKYRRQVFYGEKKRAIGEILRKLCEWKGVSIVEGSGMLSRPYPYVARDTAQDECIGICRIFERKEQPDDI